MSAVALLIALTTLAACGAADGDGVEEPTVAPSDPVTTTQPVVTTAPEPVPLAVIAETGGCYMLGPNCRTFLVLSDGSFGAFRNDPAAVLGVASSLEGADYTGTVDVRGLTTEINNADFAELMAMLPAGECRACFDGIDYEVRFVTPSGPEELSSATYAFDTSVPLFAELDEVIAVVAGAGELEPRARGS